MPELTRTLTERNIPVPEQVTYEFMRGIFNDTYEQTKNSVLHFDASILEEDPQSIGYQDRLKQTIAEIPEYVLQQFEWVEPK